MVEKEMNMCGFWPFGQARYGRIIFAGGLSHLACLVLVLGLRGDEVIGKDKRVKKGDSK